MADIWADFEKKIKTRLIDKKAWKNADRENTGPPRWVIEQREKNCRIQNDPQMTLQVCQVRNTDNFSFLDKMTITSCWICCRMTRNLHVQTLLTSKLN